MYIDNNVLDITRVLHEYINKCINRATYIR